MRGFNFNISSLFSGFNSNSVMGSFNFGDYNQIKNGSYKKLVKSYYTEQNKDTSSKDKTANKTKIENKMKDTTGLTQMKKEADGLKSALEVFNNEELWKQTDGKYDSDKIVDAVKSFVKEYNDVVDQVGKVNSTDISKSVGYMKSMTSTLSKSLTKVGVTVGTDGKLSVEEDTLKKAQVSNIKSLFSGATSYGSQTANRAGEISREAVRNSSFYSSNGTASSSLNNMFNKWI